MQCLRGLCIMVFDCTAGHAPDLCDINIASELAVCINT